MEPGELEKVLKLTLQVLHTPSVLNGGKVQLDVGQESSNAGSTPNPAEMTAL